MRITSLIGMGLAALVATCSPAAAEWKTIEQMNDEVTQTNFIIGNHCSGTLISVEERLILTNHHCIRKYLKTETREVINLKGEVVEKKYQVLDSVPVSQKQYADFEVVSSASWTTDIMAYEEDVDLAVIRFRNENLPFDHAASIYTDDQLLLGQVVYAVGNPRMLDLTVSKGVISSLNRTLRVGGKDLPYYQMDARIDGGSSGGSLYTEFGELIGVPAAGNSNGSVNLAIPVVKIREFLEENCFASVYDSEAESYEECMKPDEEEEE